VIAVDGEERIADRYPADLFTDRARTTAWVDFPSPVPGGAANDLS